MRRSPAMYETMYFHFHVFRRLLGFYTHRLTTVIYSGITIIPNRFSDISVIRMKSITGMCKVV